ncbi:MAG: metallophosphoesterase [Phycisphaerales bacterium]
MLRTTRRLWTLIPVLMSVAATVAFSRTAVARQTVRVEAVESAGSAPGQPWVIGGIRYRTTAETEIDGSDQPFAPGRLVRVEWIGGDEGPVATSIDGLPVQAKDVADGPYVFHREDGTIEVVRVVAGVAKREPIALVKDVAGDGIRVPAPRVPGGSVRIDRSMPPAAPTQVDVPGALLAISDLEGNLDETRQMLSGLDVVDDQGRWIWGDGCLVIVGDSVDRGMYVTELLWWLRELEAQAAAVGGGVHVILGNHEEMVLGGDLRYVHPKYTFTAERMGMSYDALFGPDAELGRWLRTRASVLVAGELLFVHAGYSPDLDALGLSPAAVSAGVRARLGPKARREGEGLSERLGRDRMGPLWYRGHHERYAEDWGGKPDAVAVDAILERHGARAMVIGHTVVDDVGWIDEDQRILSVDVRWARPGEAEGLLLIDGMLTAVTPDGVRRELPAGARAPVMP